MKYSLLLSIALLFCGVCAAPAFAAPALFSEKVAVPAKIDTGYIPVSDADNPYRYANLQTAANVAGILGGTVTTDPSSLSIPLYVVDFGPGYGSVNAGEAARLLQAATTGVINPATQQVVKLPLAQVLDGLKAQALQSAQTTIYSGSRPLADLLARLGPATAPSAATATGNAESPTATLDALAGSYGRNYFSGSVAPGDSAGVVTSSDPTAAEFVRRDKAANIYN